MSQNEGPDIIPQMRESLCYLDHSPTVGGMSLLRLCSNLVVVDVYFFYTKMMELKHGSQNHDTDFTIGKNLKLKPLSAKSRRNYLILMEDHISNV